MKFSAAILAVAIALAALGCGGDDDSTAAEGAPSAAESAAAAEEESLPTLSARDDPRFATISKSDGQRPGPSIEPSDRPAPKVRLVRDLKVGSGPAAEVGDEVAVRYLGVNYETGEDEYQGWLPDPPFHPLGVGQWASHVWEEGLVGMRAGGRREVILPAQYASGPDAINYVVDMIRVQPAPEPPAGG